MRRRRAAALLRARPHPRSAASAGPGRGLRLPRPPGPLRERGGRQPRRDPSGRAGTHSRPQPRSLEGGPVLLLPTATRDRGLRSPPRGSRRGKAAVLPKRDTFPCGGGHIVAEGLAFGLGFAGCPKRQRALPGAGAGEMGQGPALGHLVPARSFLGELCPSRCVGEAGAGSPGHGAEPPAPARSCRDPPQNANETPELFSPRTW